MTEETNEAPVPPYFVSVSMPISYRKNKEAGEGRYLNTGKVLARTRLKINWNHNIFLALNFHVLF
jgi:hypothetical protein